MPHKTIAPVGQLQIFHRCKEGFGFYFHRLRQKLPGSGAENTCKWIIDPFRLTKPNNVAIIIHGVSVSFLEIRVGLVTISDTPPISARHHPVFRIALYQQRSVARRTLFTIR
jgi:hypothetical protein